MGSYKVERFSRERVLELADAIEAAVERQARWEKVLEKFPDLKDVGFNMNTISSDRFADQTGRGCGTAGCIAGWALVAYGSKEEFLLADNFSADFSKAAEYLGVPKDDLESGDGGPLRPLFFPTDGGTINYDGITATEAVSVLRHLAKTGEIDWTPVYKAQVADGRTSRDEDEDEDDDSVYGIA